MKKKALINFSSSSNYGPALEVDHFCHHNLVNLDDDHDHHDHDHHDFDHHGEDIVATLFKFGRKLTLLGSTTQVCY